VRKLSSARTEFVRLWGIVFASLTTIAAIAELALRQVAPTVLLVAVSFLLWLRTWVGLRLREVETDGYWLLVSSLSKTAWIPLADVVSISRVWWPGPQRIYVEVGRDTPFGREIVFEPPFNVAALVGRHPLVQELRELAAQARPSTP